MTHWRYTKATGREREEEKENKPIKLVRIFFVSPLSSRSIGKDIIWHKSQKCHQSKLNDTISVARVRSLVTHPDLNYSFRVQQQRKPQLKRTPSSVVTEESAEDKGESMCDRFLSLPPSPSFTPNQTKEKEMKSFNSSNTSFTSDAVNNAYGDSTLSFTQTDSLLTVFLFLFSLSIFTLRSSSSSSSSHFLPFPFSSLAQTH